MSASISFDARRRSIVGWAAMVVSAVIVLVAGSRLVALSMEQQAGEARHSAQLLAQQGANAIQAQLQTLAQRARERARLTGPGEPDDLRQRLQAIAPARNGFWILTDGSAVGVAAGEQEAVNGI